MENVHNNTLPIISRLGLFLKYIPEINKEMQDTNIIPILSITFRSIAQTIKQIAAKVKIEYMKILSLLLISN
jgi:hypothetical protein